MWQPIESAPPQEFFDKGGLIVACIEGHKDSHVATKAGGVWSIVDGRKYEMRRREPEPPFHPTHWMPIWMPVFEPPGIWRDKA